MLPVIKEAREINPSLALMASPWSAPGWMKTTGSMIKGRLREDAYDPYAQYFLRFLQAYAAEGVPVSAGAAGRAPDAEDGRPRACRPVPLQQAPLTDRKPAG